MNATVIIAELLIWTFAISGLLFLISLGSCAVLLLLIIFVEIPTIILDVCGWVVVLSFMGLVISMFILNP